MAERRCSTCKYYDSLMGLCAAPVPWWLENADPIQNLTGDEQREVEPDSGHGCECHHKRRVVLCLEGEDHEMLLAPAPTQTGEEE